MKTIKIMMMALMMCFAMVSFAQVSSPLIQEVEYVSREVVYITKPDTSKKHVFESYRIQFEKEKSTGVFTMKVIGKNSKRFFIKYDNTVGNYENRGSNVSKYHGIDEANNPVLASYVTSIDFRKSAIVITGKGYSITYYMGYYF